MQGQQKCVDQRARRTLMSSVPLTGLATSLSFLTRKSQVLSMPFFRVMGLEPAVTACNKTTEVIASRDRHEGCTADRACSSFHWSSF